MKDNLFEESHKIAKSSQTKVEKLLKDHDGDLLSKGEIERLLGGRVHRRTLGLVLDYFEESNKIIQHPKKGILWIAASKEEMEKIR